MARKKTDNFGVSSGLEYRNIQTTQTEQPQEAQGLALDEIAKLYKQSKKILESINPEKAQELTRKQGRPKKSEDEKLRGYRYNLNLDKDLKDFLHYAAWKNHTSITQYINDLIRKQMENDAEWKKEK